MRINALTIRNFKGFEERTFEFPLPVGTPQGTDPGGGSFHLLIGENGSGKTSALDALAVALGIWHVAAPAAGWRNIYPWEVRLIEHQTGDTTRFDPAPFAEIEVWGVIAGSPVSWKRMIRKGGKRTTNAEAKNALELVRGLTWDGLTIGGAQLPVLAYYGAGRTWLPARERKAKTKPAMKKLSRFNAYDHCLDGRIRDTELNEWFLWEKLAAG